MGNEHADLGTAGPQCRAGPSVRLCSAGALTFLLAMGRNDGVGQISGFYVGRFMVRLVKSRDLFISTSWKTMRQSAP